MSSKPIASEETETHLLTTIEWNSMPEAFYSGSMETGIRDKDVINGKFTDFRLIQHGWYRWEDAHAFIKKALAKGWDHYRISKVMDYIKERK